MGQLGPLPTQLVVQAHIALCRQIMLGKELLNPRVATTISLSPWVRSTYLSSDILPICTDILNQQNTCPTSQLGLGLGPKADHNFFPSVY